MRREFDSWFWEVGSHMPRTPKSERGRREVNIAVTEGAIGPGLHMQGQTLWLGQAAAGRDTTHMLCCVDKKEFLMGHLLQHLSRAYKSSTNFFLIFLVSSPISFIEFTDLSICTLFICFHSKMRLISRSSQN